MPALWSMKNYSMGTCPVECENYSMGAYFTGIYPVECRAYSTGARQTKQIYPVKFSVYFTGTKETRLTQLPNYLMTNDLMTTFLELCDPRRDTFAASASDISWETISELSKLHGVTPFFYYRVRSLGLKLPEQIEKEWLGIYLYQIAEEQKARRQIKELKDALDPEGIPFILLKGASAMLRLYPQPGLRTFVDLDILIPADVTPRFKQAMAMAGYKPLSVMNSPEDEELRKFDGHLDPLRRGEGFAIEPHLSILSGRGNHLIAMPEIWEEKEETNADGIMDGHLNKEHFIIHALVHCVKHLSGSGCIEIKGFIDLLYAIRTWRIDWSKIIDISRRWRVENDILPVMATLNHYWQAGIPLPIAQEPLALNILALGEEDWEKRSYANLPAGYLSRLLKTRELPNVASQVHYALHLFFPTQENLRWRYGLSSKWFVVPYYFFHLFFTLRKFLTGLWHQSRLKTQ